MKTKQPTRRQQSSVRCPTCGVDAGEGCILVAGGLRSEPHGNRKLLAAETAAMKRIRERRPEALASVSNVANKKASDAASLARLKQALFVKPILTKSVRQKATKKQLASWSAS